MLITRRRPLILSAALNGAEYSAQQYPLIPVTPEQAVQDAVSVYREGARYAHFHSREPRSGDQFADREWFQQVRAGMERNAPEMALSFASSRKGFVANQILSSVAASQLVTPELSVNQLVELELLRAVGMDAKPHLMTIFTALETKLNGFDQEDSQAAIGSYKGTAAKGYSDPAVIAAYYQRVRGLYEARSITPEYEVTTIGALWTIEMLARRGWIPERPHLIFLFGFSARLPIAKHIFELSMAFVRYLRETYHLRPAVSVGAVIQPRVAAMTSRRIDEPIAAEKHDYIQLLEWTLSDNTPDAIRVGLEDTPLHFGKPVCNAELVALIRSECENAGVSIVQNFSRVREVFGIPG